MADERPLPPAMGLTSESPEKNPSSTPAPVSRPADSPDKVPSTDPAASVPDPSPDTPVLPAAPESAPAEPTTEDKAAFGNVVPTFLPPLQPAPPSEPDSTAVAPLTRADKTPGKARRVAAPPARIVRYRLAAETNAPAESIPAQVNKPAPIGAPREESSAAVVQREETAPAENRPVPTAKSHSEAPEPTRELERKSTAAGSAEISESKVLGQLPSLNGVIGVQEEQEPAVEPPPAGAPGPAIPPMFVVMMTP